MPKQKATECLDGKERVIADEGALESIADRER